MEKPEISKVQTLVFMLLTICDFIDQIYSLLVE